MYKERWAPQHIYYSKRLKITCISYNRIAKLIMIHYMIGNDAAIKIFVEKYVMTLEKMHGI